jgi:hypothetical protein
MIKVGDGMEQTGENARLVSGFGMVPHRRRPDERRQGSCGEHQSEGE